MVIKTFVYILCLMSVSASLTLGLIRLKRYGGKIWLPFIGMQLSLFLFVVSMSIRALQLLSTSLLSDSLGFFGALGTVISVYLLLRISLRAPKQTVVMVFYGLAILVLILSFFLWLAGMQVILLLVLLIQYSTLIHLFIEGWFRSRYSCTDDLLAKILRDAFFIGIVALPFLITDSLGSLLDWKIPAIFVDDYALPLFFFVLNINYAYRLVRWLGEENPKEVKNSINWDACGLTVREKTIAALLLEGKSSKAISLSLGLSPKTVENYIYKIFKKVGVNSRIEFLSRFSGIL